MKGEEDVSRKLLFWIFAGKDDERKKKQGETAIHGVGKVILDKFMRLNDWMLAESLLAITTRLDILIV